MKKILLVIIVLLGFLIVIKQNHYYINLYTQTELNSPIDITHHHVDVHNDCHEYCTTENGQQNLQLVYLEKKSVYNYNFHIAQPSFYIWQPPEMIV